MNLLECGFSEEPYWETAIEKLYKLAPIAKEHVPAEGEAPLAYGAIQELLIRCSGENSDIYSWALDSFKELIEGEDYFKERSKIPDMYEHFLLAVCGRIYRNNNINKDDNELYKICLDSYWKRVQKLQRDKSPLTFMALKKGIMNDDKNIAESTSKYYIEIFEEFAKKQPMEVAEHLQQVISFSTCTFDEKDLFQKELLIKVHENTLPILENISPKAAARARLGFRHWSD